MSIIVEKRLYEILATLPNVGDFSSGNTFKPNFDFGSEEDCVRFLNSQRNVGNVYPLVWVQTPFTVTGDTRKSFRLKMILATNSKSEYANSKRISISFEPILYPLLENIIKAFNRSGFTKMTNRDNDKTTNHFNYGVEKGGDTVLEANDIWDAIKFECDLEMDSCPQREIFY